MSIEQTRNNIRNKLQQKKRTTEEATKRRNNRWNKWYQSPEWKALRAAYITEHPLCEMHEKYGIAKTATSIHHKRPFGTGITELEKWNLLLDKSNLIACCESCHDEFHRQLNAKHIQYIDEIMPIDVKS